jgi:outer membrane murein-binding lipoprotein Lpp
MLNDARPFDAAGREAEGMIMEDKMRIFIVVCGLLLAGCDDLPQAHSRNEINEIVRDETRYLIGNDRRLHARIEEAEAKINELESEVSSLKSDVSYLD